MDIPPPQQANVYSFAGTIYNTSMQSTRVVDKSRRHAANQDCDAGHNDLKYEEIAYTKLELSEPSWWFK